MLPASQLYVIEEVFVSTAVGEIKIVAPTYTLFHMKLCNNVRSYKPCAKTMRYIYHCLENDDINGAHNIKNNRGHIY